MRCPRCLHVDTKVLESRVSQEGRSVRRRRNCTSCNYRFTTYEKEEELQLQVLKRDENLEPFSRTKLVRAIQTACIKRPVSLTDVEAVVAKIERMLQEGGERVIASNKIGDMTLEELLSLDHVAYVRFASIYKDFKSASQFHSEVQRLDRELECSPES